MHYKSFISFFIGEKLEPVIKDKRIFLKVHVNIEPYINMRIFKTPVLCFNKTLARKYKHLGISRQNVGEYITQMIHHHVQSHSQMQLHPRLQGSQSQSRHDHDQMP